MSCVEAFSCALLLKAADRVEKIIGLLNEGKQVEVKAVLETLQGIPPDTLRQLWGARRGADELSTAAGR